MTDFEPGEDMKAVSFLPDWGVIPGPRSRNRDERPGGELRNRRLSLNEARGSVILFFLNMQNVVEKSPPAVTVREADERLVRLTPAAGEKVVALLEREEGKSYLRLAITGGGCNGLSYKMKFVEALKKGDIVVRSSGVQVVVDSKSALYIKGTVLDYSDRMVAGGFKFSNPNAKASCSCGESFSI